MNTTQTPRRPQVGDIAIHNQDNILLYVGVVERICTHDDNVCEGSAIVTGMDNQFYECVKLHYWHADRADTIFVARPSVVPEKVTVPVPVLPLMLVPIPLPHLGDGALSEEHVELEEIRHAQRVLGSNPDEEPF